ncbi:MAG: multicopper oxidase domain-containing protein, partial [Flavobacteriaceae bacterium]
LEKVMVDGQEMDGRTAAVEHGQFWAFNGIAGMGEEPLFRTARDRTIEIRMVNRTAFPHAIHLHGHHFVETFRASGDVNEGLFDTVLLDAEEQVAVAFVADNPGKWMIHCHMLDHQASGMMSWFEVA